MQGGMNGPLYVGATVVLLPRWDRDAAAQLHPALPRHRHGR
jgi:fatty-acyl-CoA synthase